MYYIGHKNPDTDTVCAAIAAAKLFGGTPAIASEINKETEFVLDYFGVPKPEILENISGQKVVLIDHNQVIEMADGYEEAQIKGVIDHHALLKSFLVAGSSIEVTIKPWGSSSTIIADMYFSQGKEPDKAVAGIMLASILSDTFALRSPTTTKKDKEIVEKLIPLAGIDDYLAFAKEMFKAKSNIADLPAKEILTLDYKTFDMGEKRVGIGVAETVEPKKILENKKDFIKEMGIYKKESGLDYLFFFIIDILKLHSTAIIVDEDHQNVAEKVFGGKVANNELDAGSVVSRKKQIIPPLTKYFSK